VTAPALDARTLAELMDHLGELARSELPKWRPPPDGDAGTMLQRAFARLLELALERLNRVPEKNLLAFLDTMEVSLLAPAPARVLLTFTLAPGRPPTALPTGVQAATQPSAGRPAVTFETAAPLTVVPTRLVAARTVDPVGDRWRDQLAAAGGAVAQGFTPFTGTFPLAHELLLGTGNLLERGRLIDFELPLGFTSSQSHPGDAVRRLLENLVFEYAAADMPTAVTPDSVVIQEGGPATYAFRLPSTDPESIQGPGLDGPAVDRWLRIRPPAPLPLEPVATDLRVLLQKVHGRASGLLPDAVLAGGATAEPSRSFLPFGPAPRVGDALHLGSDEAFAKAGGTVTIHVAADGGRASEDLKLAWEYLGEDGWAELPISAGADVHFTAPTGDVKIEALPAVPRRMLNGVASRWIRVRISAGNYGTVDHLDPARVRQITLAWDATVTPTVLRRTGDVLTDLTASAAAGDQLAAFVTPAEPELPAVLADAEPAFYLGFDELPAERPVTLQLVAAPRRFSGNVAARPAAATAAPAPATSPVTWQYYDGVRWRPLAVVDGSEHLTRTGALTFLAPADLAPLARFDLVPRYWIRATSARDGPTDPRRLLGVFLNTVPAVQALTVADEPLGSSSGQPGQVFRLAGPPVLADQQVLVREPEPPSGADRLAIEAEEGPDAIQQRSDPVSGRTETWVRWHEVPNFVRSGPSARHYTIDHTSGTVTFGDGRRGAIPARGADGIRAAYRTGGGPDGNVPTGAVSQLQSALPAIAAVTNPVAADGGATAETLAAVAVRGPQTLRHRDRAITRGDLEWLARQASGTRVARVTCLPNRNRELAVEPGWVTLVVVPQGDDPTPTPSAELVATIEDYLVARAPVGLAQPLPSRINVIGPGYVEVSVVAEVVPRDLNQAEVVARRVGTALDRFLHPLTGGPRGVGWELGRDVYASEVAQVIEDTPGVSYVRSLRLAPSAVQRRLAFPPALVPIAGLGAPEGSIVATVDFQKTGLLAGSVSAATLVEGMVVRGFKQGDHIAHVLDLLVVQVAPDGLADAVEVARAWDDPTGFPAGSAVATLDGGRTRLAAPLQPTPLEWGAPVRIRLEAPDLVARLVPAARLSVFSPYPLTITSVPVETASDTVGVRVEPFDDPEETSAGLRAGRVLATVDNLVRLPLSADPVADPGTASVTALTFRDFRRQDTVALGPRDDGPAALSATVDSVTPVTDVVYLDPTTFAYARRHRVRMVGR
jgi:predicted phage baseplate assembly protein